MAGADIFWPMGAMALLTFTVLGQIPVRRFRAVFRKQLSPDDFRLGESDRVSELVAIPNRAMMNLLELPMLFYIIGLMAYVAGGVTQVLVLMAWVYVGLRVVHTVIHMSYNNVVHRLIPFALSNVVLISMWVTFFVGLWRGQA